jgi:hypothetical protein
MKNSATAEYPENVMIPVILTGLNLSSFMKLGKIETGAAAYVARQRRPNVDAGLTYMHQTSLSSG